MNYVVWPCSECSRITCRFWNIVIKWFLIASRQPVCLQQKGAFLNKTFFTIFCLAMTLNFDLLISKSNRFIFVAKIWWNCHEQFVRYRVQFTDFQRFAWSHRGHVHTHGQTEKRITSAANTSEGIKTHNRTPVLHITSYVVSSICIMDIMDTYSKIVVSCSTTQACQNATGALNLYQKPNPNYRSRLVIVSMLILTLTITIISQLPN